VEAAWPAPRIGDLKLFDTCVTLGYMTARVPSLNPDTALAVMDKHGITEALVHNNEARVVYPRERGNRRLLTWLAGYDRLHPVWVLEPPESPGPGPARAMVEEMLDAGVRVARLMMGVTPPFLWLWDDLCSALEQHHVPCLLDFSSAEGYPQASTQSVPRDAAIDGLRGILVAHPELPAVLSHASGGLGLSHATLPLMHRVPNLALDITSVVDYWRKVTQALGATRVFFATGMPFYDPASFVSNVQYALDVTVEEKKAICGGNIRQLMEAVR
jgi:predicted TIM-barrel fold metal-dependent hydrolase